MQPENNDHSQIIDEIRSVYRIRRHNMNQRKRLDSGAGALVRTACGFSTTMEAKERQKVVKRANAVVKAIQDGRLDADPLCTVLAPSIWAAKEASQHFVKVEKQASKDMEALVRRLPVWNDWAQYIRGFGALGLAVIIGEAGDIGSYDTVSKLWKRMGLAVLYGRRQGGLPKGSGAELWTEHGYNSSRRSAMWTIGDSLIKGNRDGIYRSLYLARKEIEAQRDDVKSKMHAHRRAQRYMEKRLLRDLWRAWRGQMSTDIHVCDAPPDIRQAASP